MEWISIKDRLPEKEGDICFCYQVGENSYGYFIGEYSPSLEHWYDIGGNSPSGHVTHWMPLPEPPK